MLSLDLQICSSSVVCVGVLPPERRPGEGKWEPRVRHSRPCEVFIVSIMMNTKFCHHLNCIENITIRIHMYIGMCILIYMYIYIYAC